MFDRDKTLEPQWDDEEFPEKPKRKPKEGRPLKKENMLAFLISVAALLSGMMEVSDKVHQREVNQAMRDRLKDLIAQIDDVDNGSFSIPAQTRTENPHPDLGLEGKFGRMNQIMTAFRNALPPDAVVSSVDEARALVDRLNQIINFDGDREGIKADAIEINSDFYELARTLEDDIGYFTALSESNGGLSELVQQMTDLKTLLDRMITRFDYGAFEQEYFDLKALLDSGVTDIVEINRKLDSLHYAAYGLDPFYTQLPDQTRTDIQALVVVDQLHQLRELFVQLQQQADSGEKLDISVAINIVIVIFSLLMSIKYGLDFLNAVKKERENSEQDGFDDEGGEDDDDSEDNEEPPVPLEDLLSEQRSEKRNG